MPRVAVLGATGRMGAALLEAIAVDDDLELAGAVTRPGHPRSGAATGYQGVFFDDDPAAALGDADFAVDFALASGVAARGRACVDAGCPWVIGSTGLGADELGALRRAAAEIAVLHSANMSLAVNACFEAAASLARVLGERYDVDIIDLHHRGKQDAPSGTALEFGRAIASARGRALDKLLWVAGGEEPRPPGRIAFGAVRAGGHAGEHRILFSAAEDCVELTHRAPRANMPRSVAR